MFGNMMEIMGKIGSFKEKFSSLKDELENEVFTTVSADQTVKITMSKLATIKDIQLADGMEKEQIEDMLVMTLNKALEQVKTEAIERAKSTAKANLPSIPGMPF